MRLPFAAALIALTLAGCNAITRAGSDSFEAARVPPEKFDGDNSTCRQKADDRVAYDIRLMNGTIYDRNRAFNATYAACMKAKGYQPRPYLKNLLPDFSAL